MTDHQLDDLAAVPDHVDEQTPEPAPLDTWPGDTLRRAEALDPPVDDLGDVREHRDDLAAGR